MKNGDAWTVHAIRADGSLIVRREHGSGQVVLPATDVCRHVELGYAATTHRAQGRTVDTAHALVNHTNTREALYVSATRGRTANTIYLDTCVDRDEDTSHGHDDHAEAEHVLQQVLDRSGAHASAHSELEWSDLSVEGWLGVRRKEESTRTVGFTSHPASVPNHLQTPPSL